MPRRNYLLILLVAAVSLVCYRAADPLARSFSEVTNLVQRRYVDHVDRQTLWAAAVRGMIGELGDPYSEYIDPQEAAEFEKVLNQEFGGIGIQVAPDPQTGRPKVISPFVGSPAYKAGIIAGDVIAKIDGQPTAGMKYNDAAARIRGPAGEAIQLTVDRPGKTQPIDFPPIEREVINIDSVLGDSRTADDSWNFLLTQKPPIGYVRIVNFGEHTVDEFQAALTQLRQQGLKGLVIDLRTNPGGVLQAAVGVCNLLLKQGEPIVSTRGHDGQVKENYVAGGGEKFADFPVAVLIDQGSASASEIVAACLQDDGRAAIIGQRSYGKGTVQFILPLESRQGAIKLTTAEYRRPNGKNIHRHPNDKESDEWGVSPNAGWEVKTTGDERQKWAIWRRDRDVVQPHEGQASAASAPNAKLADTKSADVKPADNNPAAAGDDSWREHDVPLSRAVQYIESQINSGLK